MLRIQTHPAAKLESVIIELATQKGAGRTVVFVTEPEKAQKLAAAIQKKVGAGAEHRVLTLTGTMRGFERDELVKKDEFKVFTAAARPHQDHWLVATSAGEVGVNISADQLITSLDTLDHLFQRFGRLNRFGETEGVGYLISSDKEKDARKIAALNFLHTRLPRDDDAYDISPQALFGIHLDDKVCTELPLLAPVHRWHIDVWNQTSVGLHPSRPEVAPWLHGKQDNVPETALAWRSDVSFFERTAESHIDDDDREEILEKYPVLAHEQLREPTHKLIQKLAVLFSNESPKVKVWRRRADGTTDVIGLPQITSDIDLRKETSTEAAKRALAYCELIFPPGCGSLENGMFEPVWTPNFEFDQPGYEETQSSVSVPYDVSGAQIRIHDHDRPPETRASFLATQQETGEWLLKRLGGVPGRLYPPEPLKEFTRFELNQFATRHGWRFLLEVKAEYNGDDSGPKRLLYFGPATECVQTPNEVLLLSQHNSDVAKGASEIASSLHLPNDIVSALAMAGELHDLGKQEEIWQRAAGNWDSKRFALINEAVAKPLGFMRGRQLGGFRHELASVRRAKEHPATAELDPEIRELVLHLIAVHHGHGRSYFESKAYDRARLLESDALACECADRFAKLQQKYGAWGLAYVECLLRAADGIASQVGQEQPPNA